MHLEHHPFPSPPQGLLPAMVQAVPGGCPCPSKPGKSLSLLCYFPKPSASMGVEKPLFFSPCLREKQHECHCLKKVPDWCACVQLQAGCSKLSVRETLPRYFLSICPCFLICAAGRALSQGSASPQDSKGCTSTENKKSLLLRSFWCGMKIEASSQRC